MQCIVCLNTSAKKISSGVRDSRYHHVVKCNRCGHVQLTPIPDEDNNREFYDKGLQFKNIVEPTKLDTIRRNQQSDTIRRADFVTKLIPSHSEILDIGAGFGF